jgi:Skp family chaperone for outer membrane proteins
MKISRVSRGALLAVAVAFAGTSSIAFAETAPAATGAGQWAKDHPRRAQVNGRLANQNRRIKNEVKEGEITKGQAAQLHAQDHAIRKEERTMASTNGSHITKTEQRALNQQENQVSREIGH